MNIHRARSLAASSRKNIGILLNRFRDAKKNPANHPVGSLSSGRELLLSNIAALNRLYKEYPDIKPIRCRQLSLFQ